MLSARDKDKGGRFDLESLEMDIRTSMHRVGGHILERLLNSDSGDYRGLELSCGQGHGYEFVGYRDKKLLTVLGPVTIRRAYYHDKECKEGRCPQDADLDVSGTAFSPGVRRMMARVGAYRPFALGHEDIKELAGISVDTKEVERCSHQLGEQAEAFQKKAAGVALSNDIVPVMYVCMDGTGVPVVKAETAGRKGKGEDGNARTRETKLGCVFTQTGVDDEGYPVRDEGSTTYVGAIETAAEFSCRIHEEAVRRGAERAGKTCVIGDGAPWIWNIAEEHFYGAVHIVDLYHAREHYWNAARAAFGGDKKGLAQWTDKRRKELDAGKVERVVAAIRQLSLSRKAGKELFEKEIHYFEKNKERMRYSEFRRQGLFVGSGVLEAGCRTIIGQRLKQSGMHWTVKGANNIIALRCCLFSNRWEDFWESRACG